MTAGLNMAQKGPRFQVVRLPGQFTRGRWDCWDYREPEQKHDEGILLYDSSAPASVAASVNVPAIPPTTHNEAPSTVPITGVAPTTFTISPSSSNFAVTDSSETIVVTSIAQNNEDKNQRAEPIQSTTSFVVEQQSSSSHSSTTSEPETSSQQTAPSTSQPSLSTSTSGKNLKNLGEETEANSNMGLLNAGANVVAIDNKIEQAMDLVKTHLTFAVREEVETLRTTISELEAKVSLLEQQNQMLRKYAPVEVVSNLSSIIQNGQIVPPPVPATATASVISTLTTTTSTPTTAVTNEISVHSNESLPSADTGRVPPPSHGKLARSNTIQEQQ